MANTITEQLTPSVLYSRNKNHELNTYPSTRKLERCRMVELAQKPLFLLDYVMGWVFIFHQIYNPGIFLKLDY
jgi:hypothetical protein